ncbi:MAG: NAD(P)/FAD-dependent oxidoreductase [Calditrichaeota bacterium]|nr:NAD(P)/FAD-dependent oxidoreductase [Calditrichota bacterium]
MNNSSDDKFYDVIIVGAGIAGSVAAGLLAKKGISVLLAEKDEFSGKTAACGGLFDRSYFDRYARNEDVLEQAIKKNIFHLPWGNVIYDCDQVTVKRRVFDRYLADRAKSAGAKLLNRTKAIDYRVKKPGEVSVVLQDGKTKSEWVVRGKIILFTDGPRSLAFKNPEFARQLKKNYWAYAYAYEVEGVPVGEDEAHIYFAPRLFPWGYGWIFPNKKESNIGVGAILPDRDGGELKQKLFDFIERFPPTANLLKDRPVVDKKGGFIPMWMMSRITDDSQILAGDAAGMVSPLFGAGIDYAVDAAELCVPVIEEALKSGDFSAKTLLKYDRAVKERFGKDLRKQMLIARLIIFSRKFGKLLPVKLLSVSAFGGKYSRWNKIKILFYPLLGIPRSSEKLTAKMDHK